MKHEIAGHVACMRRMRNSYKILAWEPEGRCHLEDLGVDGRSTCRCKQYGPPKRLISYHTTKGHHNLNLHHRENLSIEPCSQQSANWPYS